MILAARTWNHGCSANFSQNISSTIGTRSYVDRWLGHRDLICDRLSAMKRMENPGALYGSIWSNNLGSVSSRIRSYSIRPRIPTDS
ncbi:hypothetical protein ASPCADRAFT_203911 [Aspergillus carbonarius ITEM 5010]|uniref:Uncharacterized protein n=1 Tax=Aspergillus carbonarius (strain ITEM 5010) TaxID=602072 RepID=A0A1R3RZZ4_ASPC5|nr:hypothetical protein ASPCADRAFT_203911 [Aspergillus carbonarius ITEM 5010]